MHAGRVYIWDRTKITEYLTIQQAHCAYYRLNGYTFKQIGRQLSISARTAENYLTPFTFDESLWEGIATSTPWGYLIHRNYLSEFNGDGLTDMYFGPFQFMLLSKVSHFGHQKW